MVTLAIGTAVFGKVLKKLLAAPRPANSPIQDSDDHGMPSSHAVSLAFLASTAVFLLPARVSRAQAAPALLGYVLTSLYYRKVRGLHSYAQLAAGCAVGGGSSLLLYRLTGVAAALEAGVAGWFARQGWGDSVPPAGVLGLALLGGCVVGWRELCQLKRFRGKGEGGGGGRRGGKEE
jgi:hypothetical protein